MRIWLIEQFHEGDLGIFSDRETAIAAAEAGAEDNYFDCISSRTLVDSKYLATEDDETWSRCECGQWFQQNGHGPAWQYKCEKHRLPQHAEIFQEIEEDYGGQFSLKQKRKTRGIVERTR